VGPSTPTGGSSRHVPPAEQYRTAPAASADASHAFQRELAPGSYVVDANRTARTRGCTDNRAPGMASRIKPWMTSAAKPSTVRGRTKSARYTRHSSERTRTVHPPAGDPEIAVIPPVISGA
jgi:hypothetical protein